MDRSRRAGSPARFVVNGLLVIVVAAAAIGGGVVIAHLRHKSKATPTTLAPGATISFPTFQSKLGLTTGVQMWNAGASEQDAEMAGIAAAGARWVRTALLWRDVEPSSATQDDWSKADHLVADAQHDHLQIIFNIGGAPKWAGAADAGEFGSDPQRYADFCAKVARRYRDRVRVYELGNEPNLTSEIPQPDPATYAKVLEATYPAIKHADPNAFVLTAGLAGGRHRNGNITGVDYLTGLYQAGAKGFFDGIAFHPYTYPLLPTQDASGGGGRTRSWALMLQVRALMVRNGDGGKPIWVTEFGAPTNGPGGVSEAQQAAIMRNGFDLWKTYSWGGVISWFDYQDKGTDTSTHKDFFGIVDTTGRHKPSWSTYSSIAH
jgi:polysaccharide biosynthesis protein PslG